MKQTLSGAMEILRKEKMDPKTKADQLKLLYEKLNNANDDPELPQFKEEIVEKAIESLSKNTIESSETNPKKNPWVELRRTALKLLKKVCDAYSDDGLTVLSKKRIGACLRELIEEGTNCGKTDESMKSFYQLVLLFLGESYSKLNFREENEKQSILHSLVKTMEKNMERDGSRRMRRESIYCLLKLVHSDPWFKSKWTLWIKFLSTEICRPLEIGDTGSKHFETLKSNIEGACRDEECRKIMEKELGELKVVHSSFLSLELFVLACGPYFVGLKSNSIPLEMFQQGFQMQDDKISQQVWKVWSLVIQTTLKEEPELSLEKVRVLLLPFSKGDWKPQDSKQLNSTLQGALKNFWKMYIKNNKLCEKTWNEFEPLLSDLVDWCVKEPKSTGAVLWCEMMEPMMLEKVVGAELLASKFVIFCKWCLQGLLVCADTRCKNDMMLLGMLKSSVNFFCRSFLDLFADILKDKRISVEQKKRLCCMWLESKDTNEKGVVKRYGMAFARKCVCDLSLLGEYAKFVCRDDLFDIFVEYALVPTHNMLLDTPPFTEEVSAPGRVVERGWTARFASCLLRCYVKEGEDPKEEEMLKHLEFIVGKMEEKGQMDFVTQVYYIGADMLKKQYYGKKMGTPMILMRMKVWVKLGEAVLRRGQRWVQSADARLSVLWVEFLFASVGARTPTMGEFYEQPLFSLEDWMAVVNRGMEVWQQLVPNNDSGAILNSLKDVVDNGGIAVAADTMFREKRELLRPFLGKLCDIVGGRILDSLLGFLHEHQKTVSLYSVSESGDKHLVLDPESRVKSAALFINNCWKFCSIARKTLGFQEKGISVPHIIKFIRSLNSERDSAMCLFGLENMLNDVLSKEFLHNTQQQDLQLYQELCQVVLELFESAEKGENLMEWCFKWFSYVICSDRKAFKEKAINSWNTVLCNKFDNWDEESWVKLIQDVHDREEGKEIKPPKGLKFKPPPPSHSSTLTGANEGSLSPNKRIIIRNREREAEQKQTALQYGIQSPPESGYVPELSLSQELGDPTQFLPDGHLGNEPTQQLEEVLAVPSNPKKAKVDAPPKEEEGEVVVVDGHTNVRVPGAQEIALWKKEEMLEVMGEMWERLSKEDKLMFFGQYVLK